MKEQKSIKAETVLLDCRHFIGEKPCAFKRLCEGCEQYAPMGTKILLIKIGSMGDVLRTTPLLHALKEKYPVSHITWVTGQESIELLQNNPLIDRIAVISQLNMRFLVERFDLVLCLDKDPEATSLATLAKSPEKFGFVMDSVTGNFRPANRAAEYMFELGINDGLKFRQNKKTYQQIIHEAVELPYRRLEYIYNTSPEEKRFAEEFRLRHNLEERSFIVGLNTGAGPVFATKRWPKENFARLADALSCDHGCDVLLFGGPCEVEGNQWILENTRAPIVSAGNNNTVRQFAALLNLCRVVVTSDTLGMHVALALRKKTVTLFGSTCEQEVDLYDRGVKLIAEKECSPCYKSSCDMEQNCMDSIPVEDVVSACLKLK